MGHDLFANRNRGAPPSLHSRLSGSRLQGTAVMTDDPVELDGHRGMAAQRSTEIRRRLQEVHADQQALRRRQEELERCLLAAPSADWTEARSEEHTSELQSLMRHSYAVFCL